MGCSQHATAFAVSDVSYRARVQQIDVSSLVRGNNPIASLEELSGKRFRLRLIQLAT
jgi:hypothetical protein